jgi:2-iminobutanoate/2-iminopropanoate deaminase
MSKQPITTDRAPRPGGPYSQGLRVGNTLWVASQGPYDPVTGEIAGTTIEEQAARTLENVRAILEAGGATLADVVKTTVLLSDAGLFARFNQVYAGYFPDPKPVRTTVISPSFGVLVMIDAVASVGDD